MKTKQLNLKIEDEEQGLVSAVFSTFDVIDSDGDVTSPGAFTEGAPVRISAYNHASWGPGALPVGKGSIRTTDREAILDGKFFLDTTVGRDTFEVVKQMGDLQEWSYGYDVLEAEPGVHDGQNVTVLKRLKVHEVSPVILGAGVNTRTLAAKSAGPACPECGYGMVTDTICGKCDFVAKGLRLTDHLDAAIAANEAITGRVADAVAQRAEKGQKLADATLERAGQLKASIERLREALAIEPHSNDDKKAAEIQAQAYLLRVRHELRSNQ